MSRWRSTTVGFCLGALFPAAAMADTPAILAEFDTTGLTVISKVPQPIDGQYLFAIAQGTSGECGRVYRYKPLTVVHQFSKEDPLGCNPVSIEARYGLIADEFEVITDNGSIIEFRGDGSTQSTSNVPGGYSAAALPSAATNTGVRAQTSSGGTVFVLAHGSGTPAQLYSMSLASNGVLGAPSHVYTFPTGFLPTFVDPDSITAGPDGALYGVASAGGNTRAQCSKAQNGCGLIFRLRQVITTAGTQWKLTTLYVFQGGADGNLPQGPLTFDAKGNVYGATQLGGDLTSTDAARCTGPEFHQVYGCGVIYKLTRGAVYPWTETVLHAFHDRADGAEPQGPVTLDGNGNVFGTTVAGGYPLGNCTSAALGGRAAGCGVVFELLATQRYAEQVLYAFHGKADGAQPAGPISVDSTGVVTGVTWTGGKLTTCPARTGARGWAAGCGVLYKLTP